MLINNKLIPITTQYNGYGYNFFFIYNWENSDTKRKGAEGSKVKVIKKNMRLMPHLYVLANVQLQDILDMWEGQLTDTKRSWKIKIVLVKFYQWWLIVLNASYLQTHTHTHICSSGLALRSWRWGWQSGSRGLVSVRLSVQVPVPHTHKKTMDILKTVWKW
jgi:hypothetical protein